MTSLYLLIATTVLAAVWYISGHDPLYVAIHGLIIIRAASSLWWKVSRRAWEIYVRGMRVEIEEHRMEVGLGRARRVEL
jgi:hypothetical protein